MHHLLLRFCVAMVLVAAVNTAAGQDLADRFDYHNQRGVQFQRQGRYREAVDEYRKAVAIAQQIPGQITRIDTLFYELGALLNSLDEPKEAFGIMTAVEKWRRKNLGDDHPDTIRILQWWVLKYMIDSDPKCITYGKESVALSEKRFGKDSLEVSEALDRLCLAFLKLGHASEVEPAAARALAIREAKLGLRHEDLCGPLELLESRAVDKGEYRREQELQQRMAGLDLPDKPTMQLSRRERLVSGRAELHEKMGQFLEAEACFVEGLALSAELQKLDIHFKVTAHKRTVVGGFYLRMGLPEKALEQFQMAIGELALVDTPSAKVGKAFALNGIAKAYHLRGDLDQAERAFARAFEMGQDFSLHLKGVEYAAFLRDRGLYAEAAKVLEENADDFGHRGQEKSPDLLAVRLEQANVESLLGHRDASAKLYRQVIQTIGAAENAQQGNADLATARMGQARLAAEVGAKEQAIEAADQARRELRRYTRRVLPALGEHEQLQFLANHEAKSLQQAMAITFQFGDDRAALEAGAGWMLNAKGLAQEAIAQRTLQARGTNDPRLAGALREWLAIRYRLARLSLAAEASTAEASATSAGDRQREIAALTAREQTLAAQLGRSSAQSEAGDPWVELTSVREKIPADSVLIEIARYTPPQGKPTALDQLLPKGAPLPAPAVYLAWIIPAAGKGDVKLVELGACESIDAAVTAARKPLLNAAEAIVELGEGEAEQALHKELAVLSDKLLAPLRPHVAGHKHWIISPDGSLWLVPWSALLMEKGKYLVESHVTSLVVSGRDLVELAGRKASGNPSLVLADPDYDLADAAVATAPGASQGVRVTADDRRTQTTRSAAVRSAVSTAWQRLPGTAREAKALEPKLAAYTGAAIDLRLGRDAAELAVRDAWQPRIAVLSTHGYFVDQETKSAGGGAGFALRSPLVRCGLILAGANRRDTASGAATDDGILTGLEIVGADLRGTELVVLSACETALGEVRAAEGVAGLRQAFQLAGAQSVLASLWRVPDADTAQLMIEFYDRLAAKGDKAAALAEAQRALLASHRKAGAGAGHPFYWAAFTLTGRTDRPTVNPPQARPPRPVIQPRVQVTSATAPIMDGARQVGVARQGELLDMAGEKGAWVLVNLSGRTQPAWIERRHVRMVDDE